MLEFPLLKNSTKPEKAGKYARYVFASDFFSYFGEVDAVRNAVVDMKRKLNSLYRFLNQCVKFSDELSDSIMTGMVWICNRKFDFEAINKDASLTDVLRRIYKSFLKFEDRSAFVAFAMADNNVLMDGIKRIKDLDIGYISLAIALCKASLEFLSKGRILVAYSDKTSKFMNCDLLWKAVYKQCRIAMLFSESRENAMLCSKLTLELTSECMVNASLISQMLYLDFCRFLINGIKIFSAYMSPDVANKFYNGKFIADYSSEENVFKNFSSTKLYKSFKFIYFASFERLFRNYRRRVMPEYVSCFFNGSFGIRQLDFCEYHTGDGSDYSFIVRLSFTDSRCTFGVLSSIGNNLRFRLFVAYGKDDDPSSEESEYKVFLRNLVLQAYCTYICSVSDVNEDIGVPLHRVYSKNELNSQNKLSVWFEDYLSKDSQYGLSKAGNIYSRIKLVVKPFIRRLPSGRSVSAEALAHAKEWGLVLKPGETCVSGHVQSFRVKVGSQSTRI